LGTKSKEESQAPLRQLCARHGETFRTAKMPVNFVAAHAIRGSYVVFGAKARQGPPEILKQTRVLVGDRDARGTTLPDAHEPNCIKAQSSEGIPFGGRY
jgi:hypothetical protein